MNSRPPMNADDSLHFSTRGLSSSSTWSYDFYSLCPQFNANLPPMELIFELSSPQQQAFELHRSLSRCVTQDRKLKHRERAPEKESDCGRLSVKGINFIRSHIAQKDSTSLYICFGGVSAHQALWLIEYLIPMPRAIKSVTLQKTRSNAIACNCMRMLLNQRARNDNLYSGLIKTALFQPIEFNRVVGGRQLLFIRFN